MEEKKRETQVFNNRAGIPMSNLYSSFLSANRSGIEGEEDSLDLGAFQRNRVEEAQPKAEPIEERVEQRFEQRFEQSVGQRVDQSVSLEDHPLEEEAEVHPQASGPSESPHPQAEEPTDKPVITSRALGEEVPQEKVSLLDLIRSMNYQQGYAIEPKPEGYLKELEQGEDGLKGADIADPNLGEAKAPKTLSFSLSKVDTLQDKDVIFSIAFCNPYVRKILSAHANDPYWSETSKKIIKICLDAPRGAWIDPFLVISLADPKLKEDAYWIVKNVENTLKLEKDADASTAVKVILSRLKTSRAHDLLKRYDTTPKDTNDLEVLIKNILEVHKKYGMPLESKSLWDILSETSTSGAPKVFDSFFPPLNRTLGYEGYLTGQLVLVAGAPARGKTTFLLNEAVHQARQGRKVLYFALADMTKEDLVAKVFSILLGIRTVEDLSRTLSREEITQLIVQGMQDYAQGVIKPRDGNSRPNYSFLVRGLFAINPSNVLVNSIFEKKKDSGFFEEVQHVFNNLHIVVETENKPYIEDIQTSVMAAPIDPDIIIVDYDRSIKAHTKEGLYHEGEEVYEGLVSLAKPSTDTKKKLVLVASQIHKNYWSRVSVPLEAVAESSRKQAISDIVITIGRDMSQYPNHMGYISIVKNRRGPTGTFPYLLLPSNNIFEMEGSDLLPPPEEQRTRNRLSRRDREED